MIAGSNTWVDNTVMAFADAGLYIDAKSANNMIRGSRVEFNFGHGAIVDGSATFINNIAQTNSQVANNSYDGFYITGSTNIFIGNRVETALGFSNPDKFHRYAFNDKLNSATNKNVYVGNYVSDGSIGSAKFNSYEFPGEVPFSVDHVHLYAPLTLSGLLSVGTYMHTLPTNTNIWVAGVGSTKGGITQSRLSLGVDNNADYGGYIKVTDQNGNTIPVELTFGIREHGVDKDTMVLKNGEMFIPSLKSATGAGNKIVCVNTTTGRLFVSSNGINCEE